MEYILSIQTKSGKYGQLSALKISGDMQEVLGKIIEKVQPEYFEENDDSNVSDMLGVLFTNHPDVYNMEKRIGEFQVLRLFIKKQEVTHIILKQLKDIEDTVVEFQNLLDDWQLKSEKIKVLQIKPENFLKELNQVIENL